MKIASYQLVPGAGLGQEFIVLHGAMRHGLDDGHTTNHTKVFRAIKVFYHPYRRDFAAFRDFCLGISF